MAYVLAHSEVITRNLSSYETQSWNLKTFSECLFGD